MTTNIVVTPPAAGPTLVIAPVAAALSGLPYQFVQAAPVTSATINHNLGRRVMCDVFTSGGVKMLCEVVATSINQLVLSFPVAQSFYALIY